MKVTIQVDDEDGRADVAALLSGERHRMRAVLNSLDDALRDATKYGTFDGVPATTDEAEFAAKVRKFLADLCDDQDITR